jgi:hypothetical protein
MRNSAGPGISCGSAGLGSLGEPHSLARITSTARRQKGTVAQGERCKRRSHRHSTKENSRDPFATELKGGIKTQLPSTTAAGPDCSRAPHPQTTVLPSAWPSASASSKELREKASTRPQSPLTKDLQAPCSNRLPAQSQPVSPCPPADESWASSRKRRPPPTQRS